MLNFVFPEPFCPAEKSAWAWHPQSDHCMRALSRTASLHSFLVEKVPNHLLTQQFKSSTIWACLLPFNFCLHTSSLLGSPLSCKALPITGNTSITHCNVLLANFFPNSRRFIRPMTCPQGTAAQSLSLLLAQSCLVAQGLLVAFDLIPTSRSHSMN